jgi:hypothetical protein
VSLRIPQEARQVILEAARRAGHDFSSVANEMLLEAASMRRIPGMLVRSPEHWFVAPPA